jgi:hypothetical protein
MRMGYRSLISIKLGTVSLKNVNFINIVTSQSAIQTQSGPNSYGSRFEYSGGVVRLVNNGFEIIAGNSLQSFMNLNNLVLVNITGVEFSYNIINSPNSYIIGITQAYVLELSSLVFKYNYSPDYLIFIDQTSLTMPVDLNATYQSLTNIRLRNSTFSSNTATNIVYMQFGSDCQNILLTNNTILYNQCSGDLISIQYSDDLPSACVIGHNPIPPRYLNVTNSTFSNNLGTSLILVLTLANIYTNNLLISNNGYPLNPNTLTIKAIKTYPGAYISLDLASSPNYCVYLLTFKYITNLNYSENISHDNLCNLLDLSNLLGNITLEKSKFLNNYGNYPQIPFIYFYVNINLNMDYLEFWNNTGKGLSVIFIESYGVGTYIASNMYFNYCLASFTVESFSYLGMSNLTVLNSPSYVDYAVLYIIQEMTGTLNITNSYISGHSCNIMHLSSICSSCLNDIYINNATFSNIDTTDQLIYIDSTLALTNTSQILNSKFTNNSGSGLLLENYSGKLEIINCYFGYSSSSKSIIANVMEAAILNLINCTIEENSAPYVVLMGGSSLRGSIQSKNCTVRNNKARFMLGNFGCYTDVNSYFFNNSYTYGTIVYIGGAGEAHLTNSIIISNLASLNGIIYACANSALYLNSVTFESNVAGNRGVVFLDQADSYTITNSTFYSNQAYQGSGIYAQHSPAGTIVGSFFYQNSALETACISILESNILIESSKFLKNTAKMYPCIEALYFCNILIKNCEFESHAGEGANIFAQGFVSIQVTSSNFTDSNSSECCSVFEIWFYSLIECTNCIITTSTGLTTAIDLHTS